MPRASSSAPLHPTGASARNDAAWTGAAARFQTLHPTIRRITLHDVGSALFLGYDDFLAMPRHLIFLALIYPLMCTILVFATFNYALLPLIFPLVSGLALLGPFVAVGLYELSRRREQGIPIEGLPMLAVFESGSTGAIFLFGLILMAVFLLWLVAAMLIFRATLGNPEMPAGQFASQLFTTSQGWTLILLGNGVGALFAICIFAITVVAFPMLVDRKVRLRTAIGTSVRVVLANPLPMLAWGLIVVALLLIGALPFFVGLAVTLPILGHATWHLYRKTVEL